MLKLTFQKTNQFIRAKWLDGRVRRWVGWVVTILSVVFLLAILFRDSQSLGEFGNWSEYIGVSFVGFLIYLIALVIQLAIWSGLMNVLGQIRSGWWNVEIFSYSHLLRRLPGTVLYVIGRATMYGNYGIHSSVTIVASTLEWILIFLSSAVIFGVFNLTGTYGLVVAGLVLLVILFILSILLEIGLRFAAKARFHGRFSSWNERVNAITLPQSREIFVWFILESLSYLAGGVILLVLARAIEPSIDLGLLYITSVWAFVGGLGILISVVVPTNMGVRELTLAALLSSYLTPSAAVLISILLRVVFILGDLIWGGAFWLIARRVNRNLPRSLVNIKRNL